MMEQGEIGAMIVQNSSSPIGIVTDRDFTIIISPDLVTQLTK